MAATFRFTAYARKYPEVLRAPALGTNDKRPCAFDQVPMAAVNVA